MKIWILGLLIFYLAISNTDAGRKGFGGFGGSKGKGGGFSFGKGPGVTSRPTYTTRRPSYPSYKPTYTTQRPSNPPSRPTYTTQRPTYATQRPTTPAPRQIASAPHVTSVKPNAPPYPPNSNAGPHIDHIRPVQAVTQSNPYSRPPASNPYMTQQNKPWVPSGGYNNPSSQFPSPPSGVSLPKGSPGAPPYPVHQPSHPHPQPGTGVWQQPHQTWSTHGAPPAYSAHPQQPGHGIGPVGPPPSYYGGSAYNPHAAPPAYHGAAAAPPHYSQPHYSFPPPSQPIVPGKTVYVVDSGKGGGSGIKDAIVQGVASGTAHAVTNQVIKGLFNSGSNRVHYYPSAPTYGYDSYPSHSYTHITNNYYGNDDNDYVGQPQSVENQPSQPSQPNGPSQFSQPSQPSQPGQPNQTPNRPPSSVNDNAPVPGQAAFPDPTTSSQPGQGTPNNQPNRPENTLSAGDSAVSTNSDAQFNPAPSYPPLISNENLIKIAEELFEKHDEDLNQYVELNLQKRVTNHDNSSAPVTDEAPEPLFKIHPDLGRFPTVRTLRALYDNHQRNGSQNENITELRMNEESVFLDEIIKTPVMSRTLSWLMEHKFVGWDEDEHKDLLGRMWFSVFQNTSSGFERIFLSETFGDSGLVGLQNWIYFAHLEAQEKLNYLSYVDMKTLNGKGALVKLNYQTEGFTMQNATIFAGTPPELELALYTICFYARPNDWCQVSLGGVKFFILTHSFVYYNTILIDLGFPVF